ncbi:MAG: nuclear transport factor 2 family protein [Mesorhizobium sp.]
MGMTPEARQAETRTRLDAGSVHALAEAFIHASNAHDGAALAGLYGPGGCHREAATGSERSGVPDIEAGFTKFVAALADAHWQPLETVVSGAEAMIIYRLTGRLAGPLGPFPGNGQAIDLFGAQRLSFSDDGKLVSSVDYWSPRSFAAQARKEVG